ncbi:hypothetical protein [Pseudoduganella violacea]|uniref:Uncharacterized protein n=1 Tax=Pseudoduganella violacea TaxID=1715466 RepID=A0A7W5B9T7_9BURK|nr:hypothetical protein [Pseudoduganella violacea]MBB3119161.1 hypothetical protein [Pseudoduganella violacea]
MLKKLGFFIFAMAMGSGFAFAANEDCASECFDFYQACLDNGWPKPPTCLRNYKQCMAYCNAN